VIYFSPSITFAFASNTLLHRFSSFSGAETTLRTLFRAELVKDEDAPSVSQCTVEITRGRGVIALVSRVYGKSASTRVSGMSMTRESKKERKTERGRTTRVARRRSEWHKDEEINAALLRG
jgi:hypothetical protein